MNIAGGPFQLGMSSIKLRTIGHKLAPSRAIKLAPQSKQVDPFYTSPEWRSLMRHIKQVRGDRCQDPEHRSEHPRSGVRIYGDHIIERKDGGAPLEASNVMLRCSPCHQRKTAAVRGQRYRHGTGG